MKQIIFWLVWWTLFPILYGFMLKWLNRGVSEKEYRNKLSELGNEDFPRWYAYIYNISITLYISSMGVTPVVFIFGLPLLQRRLISAEYNPILFIPSEASLYIFLIAGLFIAICFGLLILVTLNVFYQKYWRYTQLRTVKAKSKSFKTPKEEITFSLKLTIPICIIFLPLLIFSMFSYTYVHDNGVVYSDMFSLKEKHRVWEDVREVQLIAKKSSREYLNFKCILVFDDKVLDLWSKGFLEKATKITEIFKQYEIPINATPLDDFSVKIIRRRFSTNGDVVLKLFNL